MGMNAYDSIRRLEYLLRLGYPYSMTKEDVKAIRGVLAEVERLEADNAALRGALGYPVKGEYDNRLSDGTIPMCGLCDAKEREVERLEARVFELRGADLAYAFEHKWAIRLERERDEARDLVRRLADAGEAALAGMDGGTDDALCHRGLCSRKECRQCQRNDNLHTAVAEAREALTGQEGEVMKGFSYSIDYYRDRVDELEAEVERLKAVEQAWIEEDQNSDTYAKRLKVAQDEVKRLRAEIEGCRANDWCKAWQKAEARIEAALTKIKEMREWGNDGEYGEGYYDAVDEIEKVLTGEGE